MKKRVVLVLALLLLVAAARPGRAGESFQQMKYVKGWVVDMVGGKDNANVESAPAVIELHTVKKAPLAFYDVEGDELYEIEEQKAALQYVGREIHVLGVIDPVKGRIKVGTYVDPNEQGKRFDPTKIKRIEVQEDDS